MLAMPTLPSFSFFGRSPFNNCLALVHTDNHYTKKQPFQGFHWTQIFSDTDSKQSY